jgi:hypothetical protein
MRSKPNVANRPVSKVQISTATAFYPYFPHPRQDGFSRLNPPITG